MNKVLPCCVGFLLALGLGWAQPPTEGRFEQKLESGKVLKIDLDAGEYAIVPGKSDGIVVVYQTRQPEDLKKVQVRLASGANQNLLTVKRGGASDFSVTIEVPRQNDLHVRLGAGELRVGNIEGNKDIEIHAGELNIDVRRPGNYAKVDLSVQIGEVDAAPFHASTGGFWRSYKTVGAGKYNLRAHVGVGEVTLHGHEFI